MDLKTILGDDYKDNMTVDDINAALANKNVIVNTDQYVAVAELKKIQDRLKNLALENSKKAVEKEFLNAGFKEDEYKDILEDFVSDDEANSIARSRKFITVIKAKNEALKKELETKYKQTNLDNPTDFDDDSDTGEKSWFEKNLKDKNETKKRSYFGRQGGNK